MNSDDLGRLIGYFRGLKITNSDEYVRSVKEYRDMSTGGSGGTSDMPVRPGGPRTVREAHYRGYPDWVFWTVLQELGELEPN